jgi:hypothetical protein
MTKPIYTRNVVTKEMIPDFILFRNILVENLRLLPAECNKFIKLILKIEEDDFDFTEKDITQFFELLRTMIDTIRGKIYAYLYSDILDICDNVKCHLQFISIHHLDYEEMKKSNCEFKEQLCQSVFQPDRINRFACKLNIDLDDYLEQL